MSTYDRSMTLILTTGRHVSVLGALTTTTGLHQGWDGTLELVPGEPYVALNEDHGRKAQRLILAPGLEGDILIQDAPGSVPGGQVLRIIGEGEVPWEA